MLNSNNETIHTCFRNNGLYTTRDLSWIGINLSNATNDIGLKRARAKQIYAYVAGMAKNALIIQSKLLQQSQSNLGNMEDLNLIKSAYMIKAEAVYKLMLVLDIYHIPELNA